MPDLPYPEDGGLKPQVRPYDQTLSLNDVLEAERIRQQQDPRHEQPAFKNSKFFDDAPPPVYACKRCGKDEITAREEGCVRGPCPMEFVGAPAPMGIVWIGDKSYPISDVRLDIDSKLKPEPAPEFGHEPIEVTGTITAYFQDPALLKREADWINHLFYGPAWKRELLWAVHNLFAHPLSEITHWLGYLHPKIREFGNWFHDLTVPAHAPNTGRG